MSFVSSRSCRLATLAVLSTEDSAAARRKTKATKDLQLLRTLTEGWQTAKDEAAAEKQRLIDLEKQQAADLVAAESQRILELQAATDAAAAAKKAVGNALDDASKAKLEREAVAAEKLLQIANRVNKNHDDGVRKKAQLEEKARLRAVTEAAKKAADDAKNIAVNKILHDYASVYAAYLKSHQDLLAEFQAMPGRPGRHSIDLAIVDAPWKPQLNDWTPKECTEVRDTMDYFLKDGGYIILFDKGSNLHRWIDIFKNKKLPPGGRHGEETKYQVCAPFVTGFKPASNYKKRRNITVVSQTEHWWIIKKGIPNGNEKGCAFDWPEGVPNLDGVK